MIHSDFSSDYLPYSTFMQQSKDWYDNAAVEDIFVRTTAVMKKNSWTTQAQPSVEKLLSNSEMYFPWYAKWVN